MVRTTTRAARTSVLASIAGLLIAGCGGSDGSATSVVAAPTTITVAATTTTSPPPPVTEAPTTTAAPTTTEAPTTTAAPTTTTLSAADQLVLRPSGLGAFDFGAQAATVVPAITALLGPPNREEGRLFTTTDGAWFVTDDEEYAFNFPAGREVCWQTALCVYLGGGADASPDDLATMFFWGYVYYEDPPSDIRLHATNDLMVGTVWADVLDRMTADVGGCYSAGSGTTADGISLGLHGAFSTDEGVPIDPVDPASTVIANFSAGDLFIYRFDDC